MMLITCLGGAVTCPITLHEKLRVTGLRIRRTARHLLSRREIYRTDPQGCDPPSCRPSARQVHVDVHWGVARGVAGGGRPGTPACRSQNILHPTRIFRHEPMFTILPGDDRATEPLHQSALMFARIVPSYFEGHPRLRCLLQVSHPDGFAVGPSATVLMPLVTAACAPFVASHSPSPPSATRPLRKRAANMSLQN